ncbi:FIST C-terminal domain-containing protein [Paenibacillus tritici]|uniref:FIST signal transduction protein n=1 Tax=Paenibacillus tritici TaxID=1873425 RepID=UPI001BA9ADDB|nr:FIST N-terminal domain-containing protein [Paenibacillus tritici]QUL56483.1 FIST C-terminal domain-containing protein [Paenibacillus tritici]
MNEARRHLEELDGNRGLVLFASAAAVRELSLHAPSRAVLCSTKGEYTPQGYRSGVITGFEYEADLADIVEILHPPVLSASALDAAYRKVEGNANAFLLLLCDGKGGMEEMILSSLYFMDPQFKVIGGSAADDEGGETYLYMGTRRVRNLGIYFNMSARTALVKENIYVRTGKTLLVTEADVFGRTVYSFNGRPAAGEYARVLGVPEEELAEHFLSNPLGKRYEDDLIIASPMAVRPDGAVTFYSQVMSSTYVEVLSSADPLAVLEETLGGSPYKPSFVLNINCTLRDQLFTRDGLWGAFDMAMLEFCGNTTGFISYGEQYYNRHANQTMILLLVE